MNQLFSIRLNFYCLAAEMIFIAAFFSEHSYAISNALKVKIASDNYSDETVIRFLPGATGGFDGNYDAWKLFSVNPLAPGIFSKDSLGDELAINALGEFHASVTIDIFLRIGSAGTYSISATEPGAFGAGVKIVMKDLASGRLVDLRAAGTYTFDLSVIPVSSEARFKILFSFPAAIEIKNSSCSNCSDGTLAIDKKGETNWLFEVYNAVGSMVVNGLSVSASQTVNALSAGNYTVIVTGNYSNTECIPVVMKVSALLLGASSLELRLDQDGGSIRVEWSTASETNTGIFTIERSADGLVYQTVESVKAAGQSSEPISYSAMDQEPPEGRLFYRIKVTDLDGAESYSSIAAVSFSNGWSCSVFPNPCSGQLAVTVDGEMNAQVTISLLSLTGEMIYTRAVTPASDHEIIPVTSGQPFAHGLYTLAVRGHAVSYKEKIIIN